MSNAKTKKKVIKKTSKISDKDKAELYKMIDQYMDEKIKELGLVNR